SAVWGNVTGTLSDQTDLQSALDAKLSLTSWYATTTDGLDEGSTNQYFTNTRVQTYLDTLSKGYFFSTTSASHFLSQNTGASFSTTSANYWETQQTARTADDLTNNSIEDLSDVLGMSESFGDLLSWTGSAWTNIATSTLGVNLGDTTGTLAQSRGGTGLTSYASGDILYADNAGNLTALPKGTNGQVLKLTGGLPAWGTDITSGGGGGSTAWSTTTDSLGIYATDTSDVLILGASATSTSNSILEVFGTSYFSNTLGIATTVPSALFKFAVGGNALFSGNVSTANIIATGTATTSSLSVTGVTSSLLKTNSIGRVSGAVPGTDYLAPSSLSSTATGLTYTSGTGVFSLTSGYTIPLTASTTEWATAYTNRITSATYPLQISSNVLSLAFGTTTANSWSAHNIFTSLFATNAST
ncbi:MAG: hypothetical protein KBC16_02490, partial [Candidatus Pacebacteria bacterium]|nr:hypothetical protein [Candidatus Paceibacterota bacterium]